MSELPDGWRLVRLGEVGQWYGGGTPSKSRQDFWQDGSIPWLSPKDMRADVLTGTADQITRTAVTEAGVRLVPAGSVALVVRSGILERMLPIAEVPFETTLNQDMKAVLPSPEVNARFLRFALQSKAQRSLATLRKAGTTVASIDSKALMHMQVPVPPLDEQHRIVALLENHLSRLDAARNYLEACQSRSSRLQPPLPGGAPVRLGDLVREMRYGTSVKCSYDASGPAVLRIPNVVRGNLDLTDLKYATSGDDLGAFRLRAGDVLVIRSNGSLSLIGRMAAVDGTPPEPVAFASYLIRVRVDDERLSPHWLTSLAGLPEVRGQIEGSAASSAGQHNLNKTTLLNLRIPMPSLNDQEAWLAQARELRASTDRLRADVGTAVKHGRRLQASLLEAAFAGLL